MAAAMCVMGGAEAFSSRAEHHVACRKAEYGRETVVSETLRVEGGAVKGSSSSSSSTVCRQEW